MDCILYDMYFCQAQLRPVNPTLTRMIGRTSLKKMEHNPPLKTTPNQRGPWMEDDLHTFMEDDLK